MLRQVDGTRSSAWSINAGYASAKHCAGVGKNVFNKQEGHRLRAKLLIKMIVSLLMSHCWTLGRTRVVLRDNLSKQCIWCFSYSYKTNPSDVQCYWLLWPLTLHYSPWLPAVINKSFMGDAGSSLKGMCLFWLHATASS